jgi:hypothetical protein
LYNHVDYCLSGWLQGLLPLPLLILPSAGNPVTVVPIGIRKCRCQGSFISSNDGMGTTDVDVAVDAASPVVCRESISTKDT